MSLDLLGDADKGLKVFESPSEVALAYPMHSLGHLSSRSDQGHLFLRRGLENIGRDSSDRDELHCKGRQVQKRVQLLLVFIGCPQRSCYIPRTAAQTARRQEIHSLV